MGVMALLLTACGGSTGRNDAELAERRVADLRFDKLVAGRDRYCGLTQGDRALVCVERGKISVQRPGPFQDFALDESFSFAELCTLDLQGELNCDKFTDAKLPPGSYHSLALGFFNGCALDSEGRPVCWVPAELGGTPDLPVEGALRLSVDLWHACAMFGGAGHVQCFGLPSDEVVNQMHFIQVSASGMSTCGITLAPTIGDVVCVDDSGVTLKLAGSFRSLDTNADGDGCASDLDGKIRCWGSFKDPEHTERLGQVTVSPTHVCALDADGAAHCFR